MSDCMKEGTAVGTHDVMSKEWSTNKKLIPNLKGETRKNLRCKFILINLCK